MLFRPVRMALSAFTTFAVLYVAFFVPIGRRTLWQHAMRIAGTPEAQEFGHDAVGMSRDVMDRARTEIQHGIPVAPATPSDGADGGLRVHPTERPSGRPRER